MDGKQLPHFNFGTLEITLGSSCQATTAPLQDYMVEFLRKHSQAFLKQSCDNAIQFQNRRYTAMNNLKECNKCLKYLASISVTNFEDRFFDFATVLDVRNGSDTTDCVS